MRRKWLGAVVALGLAGGAGAPAAQADPIGIQGCYGAAVAVYCNPTVTGVETGTWGVPVCAGSCTVVNVPVVREDPAEDVCVRYQTYQGYWTGYCVT